MKKGDVVATSILRLIAIAGAVINIFTGSELCGLIGLLFFALAMIIDTILYIVRRREIKWLFLTPLASIGPLVSIWLIISMVFRLVLDKELEVMTAFMISATLISAFWFFDDIIKYQKKKREEAERYDDYYDHHDNYRY